LISDNKREMATAVVLGYAYKPPIGSVIGSAVIDSSGVKWDVRWTTDSDCYADLL
jgi:hypothetical protein